MKTSVAGATFTQKLYEIPLVRFYSKTIWATFTQKLHEIPLVRLCPLVLINKLIALRHFGRFLCREISVICLIIALKLTVTVFVSLYFQTFWPK